MYSYVENCHDNYLLSPFNKSCRELRLQAVIRKSNCYSF